MVQKAFKVDLAVQTNRECYACEYTAADTTSHGLHNPKTPYAAITEDAIIVKL